jgi:EAL domain-containing protein (putative c-di-GMP-specific phosphodiesterase class I)
MNQKSLPDFNEKKLRDLLEKESVATVYQPIVSVKKRSIIGFEALSRGITDSGIISPCSLFELAKSEGLALELDRLCRKKAIENFVPFIGGSSDYILSINIESSILYKGKRSNHLLNMVDNFGLNPSSVVIEILESEVSDLDVLQDFVKRYRENKFLIAIDDVGSGFSNFGRIIDLCPDVIKLDRSLIIGIDHNFYSQEVVKSLINMAHGIGAMIVAEGIEEEAEAITCLELGADFLQGYCFGRPDSLENIINNVPPKINHIAGRFREQMLSRVKTRRENSIQHNTMIDKIIFSLLSVERDRYDQMLSEAIMQFPSIECCYIINEEGIQIGNTVCSDSVSMNGKKFFCPDPSGTDQSYKDYFFSLQSGLNRFTSDPYISGATGRLCVTISTVFSGNDSFCHVLCCDIEQTHI